MAEYGNLYEDFHHWNICS